MKTPRPSGPIGSYYERPITSERAELVPWLMRQEGRDVVELLALGRVTLRAVAVARYGGDVGAALRDLYPGLEQEQPGPTHGPRRRRRNLTTT